MNLLILSDSHRNRANILAAYKKSIRTDAILFLGDGVNDFDNESSFMGTPLFMVQGNCDLIPFFSEGDIKDELTLSFEGYRILMMHGHRYDVKFSLNGAVARANELGADILLYGHTHVPHEEYIPAGDRYGGVILQKPLYILNPGSIGQRTGGAYSFGTLTLSKNGVMCGHGNL